jgi:hypothetical protein
LPWEIKRWVEQVNQFRHMFATEVAPTIDAKPPSALRGHMTNWGWFSEGETAAEQDWDERLKAWDLATQLAEQAREGGLLRGSDADCPYGAFVTLAPRSSSLKDTKPRLGLEANEMLECDYDLGDQLAGAERIAYLLFFGYDALSDGVDKWVSSEDQKAARQVAATMDQHLKDVRLLSMDRSEKSDGRYVCSPEYGLGLTSSGKYLVGLWAYVVQS